MWPGSRAPFAVVFACNAVPDATTAMLQFVSPAVTDDRQKKQTRLRIDWNDAQPVAVQSIIAKPWLLKVRFRGGAFDERVIDKLIQGQPTLDQYLVSLRTHLRRGYELESKRSKKCEALEGLPDLVSEQRRSKETPTLPAQGFRIATEALATFESEMVHRQPSRDECRAPLLLVKKSPPADPSIGHTSVSQEDVAYSQSWFGASFAKVEGGLSHAQWLQLVLQSKAFLYVALLTDGWFGVERDHLGMDELKRVPVLKMERLVSDQLEIMSKLSESLWVEGWSEELQERIDDLVFDLYGLDDVERDTIRDTLATSLPYAKQRHNALLRPTPTERSRFAETLQDELTSVLAASHERAEVLMRRDTAEVPWTVLQVNRLGQDQTAPNNVAIPWAEILTEADASGATLITVRAADATTMVALLDQYRYWTVTRARILALSLLSKEWA